jgi:Cft2 family RNA processing exonuclease
VSKSIFKIDGKSIFIPAAQLHLDASSKKSFGFISHAHSDHIAKHQKILCTDKTAQLLDLRLKKPNCLTLPFYESRKIDAVEITLLPAGHILGSAQVLIKTTHGSLLYTGDLRTKASRTVEKYDSQKCDTLIMESTFGLPHYCFPPRKELEEILVATVREKLNLGITPIVFAYSLGKGQEVLHLLGNSGLPVAVDYTILRYAKIYEKFDIDFGSYQLFKRSQFRDRVLLLPTSYCRNRYVESIEKKYTIYLSGWGMDDSAPYRLGVDEVLPYSDHADFNELIEYVSQVKPDEVFCTHGFDQFVTVLRNNGFNAKPLFEPQQMELF